MKYIFTVITLLALCAASLCAQDLRAGFFVDNYLDSYRINPALRPSGTTSFYGLGTNVGINSNIGVSSFLFPYGDGLVTGLNQNVSADEFLGGLKDSNKVTLDLRQNIFSRGKYSRDRKTFTTVGVSLRSYSGVEMPKSLFEMLKAGGDGDRYVIKDINLNSRNYMEVAFGMSRKIGDALTVGGSVKGLLGLVAFDAEVSEISAVIDDNVVTVTGNGTMRASLPVSFEANDEGNIDFTDIPDMDGLEVSGYGGAVDLGATYELLDGALLLSAAVTDLGFITWNNNTNGTLASSSSFTVNESDDAGDTLEDMFQFKSEGDKKNKASMLPAMVNLGAKYDLPFVPGLGVGALCSFRMGGKLDSYTDIRAGVSYRLGRVFDVAGTCGMSSEGFVYGAAANLRLAFINLFAGIDGIPSKVTPQFVPVNSLSSVVKFGFALSFGKGPQQ